MGFHIRYTFGVLLYFLGAISIHNGYHRDIIFNNIISGMIMTGVPNNILDMVYDGTNLNKYY